MNLTLVSQTSLCDLNRYIEPLPGEGRARRRQLDRQAFFLATTDTIEATLLTPAWDGCDENEEMNIGPSPEGGGCISVISNEPRLGDGRWASCRHSCEQRRGKGRGAGPQLANHPRRSGCSKFPRA